LGWNALAWSAGGKLRKASNAETFLRGTGRKYKGLKMSQQQGRHTQMLLPGVIPVQATVKLGQHGDQSIPTFPDTSLPWSQDFALGGWSARMFLHQVLQSSARHWTPSDTEALLLKSMPLVLQASPGYVSSLSDAVKPAGNALLKSYCSEKMLHGLLRRALRRARSLRVLLRTHADMTPATITFGTGLDCESWTATSEKNLPGSLLDGLMDFLKARAPRCMETPSCRKSRSGSAGGSSKPKPQSGGEMETEIVLADIVLPCVYACGELIETTEQLERHVERGCMEMPMVRPFYCGSQFSDWTEKNCDHCKKIERCDIKDALWEAYVGDGNVSHEIGKRMNYSSDQPGYYSWPCNEVESTTPEHAEAVRKWRERDDGHNR